MRRKDSGSTGIPPYLQNMHPDWGTDTGDPSDPDDLVSRYFNYLAAVGLFEERTGLSTRDGPVDANGFPDVDCSVAPPPEAVREAAMVARHRRVLRKSMGPRDKDLPALEVLELAKRAQRGE